MSYSLERQGEWINEYVQIQSQEVIDDEVLDTTIVAQADLVVAGNQLEEFAIKLEKLIDEYRI